MRIKVLSNARLKKRNNWTTDLVILTLLLLVFYTFWLGSYPLFTPDEGRYSEVAREMVVTGDYITPRVNGVAFLDKPVLYYWLQAAAILLFGVKEWALRLFPVLSGILGCLVTYICGRHLFDRRTGLISAIILATTPLYFGGAHYANLDLEVAVWISCALLFFITGIQNTDPARRYFLLAAYAFSAFAFLTKGLIGIAFPALIAGTWIILRWRSQTLNILRNIHLIKGIVLFTAIVLPWYILVQKANPEFLHYFFITQQVTRFISTGTFNNPTPFWFYVPIVLIGFFPWTSFLFQALKHALRDIRQSRIEYQTELYLILWLSIVFIFFSIPRSKTITYILPILPALALLVGRYLSLVWNNANQSSVYRGIVSLVIISVLFFTGLLMVPYFHWDILSTAFTPYLYVFAIIVIINAIVAFCLKNKKTLFTLFTITTSCSILLLLTLTFGATHLNKNSVKPLVLNLKTIIRPEDEVITYFKFPQDVPIYLERRVTIVADWNSSHILENDNWQRELWYGMPFQDTSSWLINEDTFWERWNNSNRVFVFLKQSYFEQFKKQASQYFFIGEHNNILLLSNQPNLL
jgi:4-amino-4-deoxy-L-arabinose transferase-like glycosyltransferase